MIGYVTLGSDDLPRARAFYDALLGTIGATRLMEFGDEFGGFTMWGTAFGKPGLAVTNPYNKQPAVAGNGNMAAIVLDERAEVDALYAKALELGGTDEGAAGRARRGRRPGLLRRLFSRSRRQQALRLPDRPRLAALMRVRAIVNASGGALANSGGEIGARIEAAFASAGVEADVRVMASDGISAAFEQAAREDSLDAVVAAGGDGTVSSAASQLAGTRRPLGVLPMGTLNHLARDAGIPIDLDAAVTVIAGGKTRAIDVGELNGRVFVNNSAVGLYPDMVRFRDAEQAATGRSKRLAMLSASLRALQSFKRRRLWISAPGVETPLRTPLLFVGVNRYRVSLFALGRREALDGGELCVYAVRARSRAHLFWAGLRGLIGKLDQQRDFVTFCAEKAEISSDRDRLTVSADGESFSTETPLRYRIRQKALRLIVPA